MAGTTRQIINRFLLNKALTEGTDVEDFDLVAFETLNDIITDLEMLRTGMAELVGSAVVDVASIAGGAEASVDITVTGAALGDYVTAWSATVSLAGLLATAEVDAADSVKIWLHNPTGSAIDLASATWRARVSSVGLVDAAADLVAASINSQQD